MLLEILIGITITLGIAYIFRSRRSKVNGAKAIPEVAGRLPYVGNGFQFQRDIIKFIQQCHAKYGDIFMVKIFRKKIAVVCNHEFEDEFFKASESDMSLYDVLDNLYFGEAFADDKRALPRIISIIKKTIKVNFDDFAPKIMEEAHLMMNDLRKNSTKDPIRVADAMIKFVSRTSARCFIGMDIEGEFYEALMSFTHLLNKIVVMTYFFPKWLLRLGFAGRLRKHRMKMINLMNDEINTYRTDPTKCTSTVFRKSVDWEDKDGYKLNNREIGEIVTCLLYVSSENTALGLAATMIDLSRNEAAWNMVKKESTEYLEQNDISSLFGSPVLESCVLESARINSHVFALQRLPKDKTIINGYDVSDVDSVALCEPMLMIYNQDKYKDPTKYNPMRFITGSSEPKNPKDILAWGAGRHLCPGKQFAIYEIKAAMALLTTNFEKFTIPDSEYGSLDYFSPSAFAERDVKVILNPLPEDDLIVIQHIETVEYEGREYTVTKPTPDSWLIKNFLTKDEQMDLFAYTYYISTGSEEHKSMNKSNRAQPFAYYNLVYTDSSNCNELPIKWIDVSRRAWEITAPDIPMPAFDSVYAQLYDLESVMPVHKDSFVNWGVSISIGCSCEFQFGEERIILNTGDAFIADFSKTDHGVNQIINNAPGWFSDVDSPLHEFTFGKARMSVQIRENPPHKPKKLMTIDEFGSMVRES